MQARYNQVVLHVDRHNNSAVFSVTAHYSQVDVTSVTYTLKTETVSSSETVYPPPPTHTHTYTRARAFVRPRILLHSDCFA
jgi:hypothetical protein